MTVRLHELVLRHPRYGYRRMTALLQREGWRVNRKRVYRLWRLEGFKVPRKVRRRRAMGCGENSCAVRRALHKDHAWTWDFLFDRTTNGRPLKWLSIVDEYTRECLALEVDRTMPSEKVIDVLHCLVGARRTPAFIRSDNGPEFIAQAIRRWLGDVGSEAAYVAPAAPWENGFAESFHSRLRDELLNTEEFQNVCEAKAAAQRWRDEYNNHRPHSSLGYQTPNEFAAAQGGCCAAAPLGS